MKDCSCQADLCIVCCAERSEAKIPRPKKHPRSLSLNHCMTVQQTHMNTDCSVLRSICRYPVVTDEAYG